MTPNGHPYGCECTACLQARYRYPGTEQPPEPPCPAWADGQHCYVAGTIGGLSGSFRPQWERGWQVEAKRCACGKTVERT